MKRPARWLIAASLGLAALCCQSSWAQAESSADAEPRIISLAPHLTELAFEAGIDDWLVGVVEWSDWPPEARTLPRIGDAFRFDLETIVRLRATHALAWQDGTPAHAIERLREAGLEVIVISIQRLEDIATAIERLGQLGHARDNAATRAENFRQALESFRSSRPAEHDTVPVFYQVAERPLFTLGGRHVINDVFALCGAQNIFSGLASAAASVDFEAVLAREPLAMIAGGNDDGGDPFSRWHQFPHLDAVSCGHMLEVDPALLVRPTPRLLDGARRLCEWLDTRVRQAEDRACRSVHD